MDASVVVWYIWYLGIQYGLWSAMVVDNGEDQLSAGENSLGILGNKEKNIKSILVFSLILMFMCRYFQ